jgi:AICAR transformylase/IMP cyclohydrolase PurH
MSEGAPAALRLRYGLNPHQTAAYAEGPLPFEVLNGSPGYLNLLDALAGWHLVRDGRIVLGRPVAASIKHAGPNGVGTDVPLSPAEAAAFQAPTGLSPVALAYVRARGTDRVAAYGDFVAVSEPADESLARAVRAEVVTGVIAPSYQPGALELLRRKRNGQLLVLRVDPDHDPVGQERRDVFGVRLWQDPNRALVTREALTARGAEPPDDVLRDLLVATLAARHASSNAVCLAARGQTVGLGAGQPSRVQATRLAVGRAEEWLLRQHPDLLRLRPGPGMTRHDLDTAVAEFTRWNHLHPVARQRLAGLGLSWPSPLEAAGRAAWLDRPRDLVLSGDGPFPFPDSLHVAAGLGVRWAAHPGGAGRDASVAEAAERHHMTLLTFDLRLFQH